MKIVFPQPNILSLLFRRSLIFFTLFCCILIFLCFYCADEIQSVSIKKNLLIFCFCCIRIILTVLAPQFHYCFSYFFIYHSPPMIAVKSPNRQTIFIIITSSSKIYELQFKKSPFPVQK